MSSIGVPIKLLHEAEGHIITIELKSGDTYRGKLSRAEDNFNMNMTAVNATSRDGKQSRMETIYIRGSKVRFLILPDMLKNAPFFKRVLDKVAELNTYNLKVSQANPKKA